MLKKFFVLVTLGVCITGLSFSAGCSGGPGEYEKGKATNKDFGEGVGEIDGEKAPEGAAVFD